MFDLPLVVERGAGPLRDQLVRQLRAAMRDGRLAAGERLPSGRALAASLGVSRTVVTEAYEQLYAEGWIEGRHGSGTYVTDIVSEAHRPRAAAPEAPRVEREPAAAGTIDLRPGTAFTGSLDTPAWRRAWRLAASAPLDERTDPRGQAGLRAELAEYLRRSRGVVCPPDRIVVTRGATSGLALTAAAVLRPGLRVGVEEPGFGKARAVLAARGLEVVPCRVDGHGLVVADLPDDLALVYTTPSHQYPLGGVLPVPRRQALVAWARRTGALVAEDDYDGEFRFDVAPLPALHGLDPDVVVYLGTTAKILTSRIGVGWLAARPDLAAAVARYRESVNDRAPDLAQEALRVLLARGDLDRHVRRMRGEYARRRAVATDALAGLDLRGDTAGLHLVVALPAGAAERVRREAAERGVLVDALGRYQTTEPELSGLVIGYGAAPDADALRTGCSLVRELAAAARDRDPRAGAARAAAARAPRAAAAGRPADSPRPASPAR
ncbi:PLP-dependent aminotransferase family protein [Actinomadura atramentaria]|uniref:MocR-like pyridoxine biosynthesis transcription factor PdxR n=1 Tax=Actinomadura atramentaria TaxID=1990 RepID=UPI000363FE2B|nr:PLP-dependent aminotransferase family protein [Actinomadura atramentaria]